MTARRAAVLLPSAQLAGKIIAADQLKQVFKIGNDD